MPNYGPLLQGGISERPDTRRTRWRSRIRKSPTGTDSMVRRSCLRDARFDSKPSIESYLSASGIPVDLLGPPPSPVWRQDFFGSSARKGNRKKTSQGDPLERPLNETAPYNGRLLVGKAERQLGFPFFRVWLFRWIGKVDLEPTTELIPGLYLSAVQYKPVLCDPV